MKPFFQVQDVEQVHGYARALPPLPAEQVELAGALGRTLAADLEAPHDLPGFTRATMDGFALRAADTFGAGEGSPAYLEISSSAPAKDINTWEVKSRAPTEEPPESRVR